MNVLFDTAVWINGVKEPETLPARILSDVAVGGNASFSLGGAAASPSSFSSDVGANFSYHDRLVFDNE